jgi:PBP1b-binding outer membrane lipoprotein LpoB
MKRCKLSLVISVLGLSLLALGLSGCGEAPHRISNGEGIVTTSGINIQDWDEAAAQISQAVLASGKLTPRQGPVAILGVARFVNDTSIVDLKTDVLINKICIAFTESRKAQAIDPAAAEIAYTSALTVWEAQDKTAVLNGTPRPPKPAMGANPDYLLNGSITQIAERQGNARQSTFIFHLRLADVVTGTSIWQGQAQITKGGTRAGIGF